MEPWMRDLVPLKSSLSVILSDAQVWSNAVPMGSLNSDFDKLGVFAQRLVDLRSKNESVCEREKRTKKSRQVFTFSQPTGSPVDFAGNGEVYESTGQEMGPFCAMEPHMCDRSVAKQVGQPARPPDPVLRPQPSAQTSNSEHRKFALPQAHSECGLKACLPCPKKPSLFYSVSDSSLPILKNSSLLLNKSRLFLGDHDAVPVYGTFSRAWFGESNIRSACLTQRRSIPINRHKNVLVKYARMDEDLAKKIAEAFEQAKANRGKFMSYAKFNSRFKLSEVFYEGINSRNVSHAPSLRAFQLSGLIHKVNPDYDEDQSITEALTVLKSLSSMTAASRITKLCRLGSSKDLNTGVDYGWIESNIRSCGMSSKIEPVSHTSADTGSLYDVLSTVRKQQLFTLRDSLRRTLLGEKKETDIWSSTSTVPKAVTATPKRLVDIASPSCIFRASLVEAMKRPVWRLKNPDKIDRTDQANEFIFKAHNYMHVRDRPNSYKCFFQPQPSYRVVDESVQFPDVESSWDRSSKGPQNDGDKDPPKDESFEEVSNELPKDLETPPACNSADNNPPGMTNSNDAVTHDQTCYSASEFHSVSSDPVRSSCGPSRAPNRISSLTLPKSTSSNRCQSSLNLTSLTSSQPLRKLPKLEPIVEAAPKCRKPKANQFCRSYPAFCDKRKIRIKYDNGRYTVSKEKDGPRRQTIWSILRGKATRLLKSVVPRGRHVHRRGR